MWTPQNSLQGFSVVNFIGLGLQGFLGLGFLGFVGVGVRVRSVVAIALGVKVLRG